VDRELAALEQAVDLGDELVLNLGQALLGQHLHQVRLEFGAQALAVVATVGTALGQEHRQGRQRGGGWRLGAGRRATVETAYHLGQVLGQEHYATAVGLTVAQRRVQPQRALALDLFKEGVAQRFVGTQRWWQARALLFAHRLEQDAHDPRLVVDEDAGAFGGGAEFGELAQAPVGLDVARRHHGDEQRRLRELRHDLVAKDLVAAQPVIAPQPRFRGDLAAQVGRELLLEPGHPAPVVVGGREVVDMGVADEGMLFEGHPRAPVPRGGLHRLYISAGAAGNAACRRSSIKPAPVADSACLKKVAACCCTRRYGVVCSGRWRS